MLQDCKVLTEHELDRKKKLAAKMYLDFVTYGITKSTDDYDALRDDISSLEFDLKIMNEILEKETK